MGIKWKSTPFRGVRYREHPTRKHGIHPDRYFAIRYQKDGQRREKGLGWASEKWSTEKAVLTRVELKNATQAGKGLDRLSNRRKEKRQKEQPEEQNALTFSMIFNGHYYPIAKEDKTKPSYKREKSLFKKWIQPTIGHLPMKQIGPIHLYRIQKYMRDEDLAERSIQYALAVIRQVFNFAFRNDLWIGDNPVKKVKPPSVNNRRTRYLTPEEAKTLLNNVKTKSQELFEICTLSLHCGLRAGEIFKLRWADVDINNGMLAIRDTRSTGTNGRYAYMTTVVKDIFLNKKPGGANAYIFGTKANRVRPQVSKTFNRTVADLKFNGGVDDRRERVCFHTLRHTYASWLVQSGIPLYEVKERLGHRTLTMTERYSHLSPVAGRATVDTIEKLLNPMENDTSVTADLIRMDGQTT